MQTAVTLQHELSADEDLALRRAIHRAQLTRKPMLGFGVFCAVIGVVTSVQAGMEYGVVDGLSTALPWTLLTAVWVSLAVVPFAFWSRHPRIVGKHERTLDDSGLKIRAGVVAFDLPWHAMRRTVETAEFFLFFDEKSLAHYLPKRGLHEREHREILRLIAAHSPESVRRLGP